MADLTFTTEQQAAIDSNSSMVITACPGSGKTTVVVEKIRKEINLLASFQGVIGITFTVKASKELNSRCKRGGFDIKNSFFGTIDHFCLSEIIYPFISRFYGKPSESIECRSIKNLDQNTLDKIPKCTSLMSSINTGAYQNIEDEIIYLYKQFILPLEYLGLIANYILVNSTACRKYISVKYRSVYVDEYQDSSEPQHQLFLELINIGLKGIAVGDIQQSIYAWRGSKSEYISQLTKRADIFEHHIVNINHRCHPSITNYANRLFDNNCLLSNVDDIRVFQWTYTGTQVDVAIGICHTINDLIKNKLVSSFSQIAVLVRNNNSLEFLANNLKVPFRIFDEDPLSLRNTVICNIFSGLLRFVFDQNYHANEVIEISNKIHPMSSKKTSEVRRIIHSLALVDLSELADYIVLISEELSGLTPSKEEVDLLKVICNDTSLLKHYKPVNDDEVQVMTLHKSKGLEFEAVFHLDLYDWIFPKREYIQGNFDEIFTDWQQDLNLHFVGITRAKNYCFLITSTNRINFQHQTKNGSPSQFLKLDGLNGLYNT